MTESETQFQKIIKEMEELIFNKAHTAKIKSALIEKSDFFDVVEFTKNNNELDSLRKRYVELSKSALEIDNKKATIEIKKIIKTKKELDENFIRDMKNALRGDHPAWFG